MSVRLIDTLTARLTGDPLRTSDRRALAEALEVRARAPGLAVRHLPNRTPRPDDVRAAEADELVYFARAEGEWRRLMADDPNRAEYRFIAHDYLSFEWKRLCVLAAKAEQVRLKRLAPPKDGFPLDLAQRINSHRDRMYADLRAAIDHYPDRAADADILRERVGDAVFRSNNGVESAPAAVREQLLAALFRADLSRAEVVPSPPPADPSTEPTDGVWKDDRLTQYTRIIATYKSMRTYSEKGPPPSDNYQVAQAAWGEACRESPRYPWAEAFAVVLRCEGLMDEVRERQNWQADPVVAKRVAELYADLWKGIAQARSQPAASPFLDGRPLHAYLRGRLLDFVVKDPRHLAGGLDEFAAWKADQANPAPTELRERLLWQFRCFRSIFAPEFTKVPKERMVKLAVDTYRDFEDLFRHPGEGDHVPTVAGFVTVASYLARHHYAAQRYDDVVRVARAAVARSERLPTPKNSIYVNEFTSRPFALLDLIATSHLKAKRYPEALAAFDEYLAFGIKRNIDVRNSNWAGDELRARTAQAVAVLRQGKADDAVRRSITAIRRFWDGVEEADKRSPTTNPYVRHSVQTPVLRNVATFGGELRVAKADAAFDHWVEDVQPLLEKVMKKVSMLNIGPPAEEGLTHLLDLYRVRMWELFDAGRTKVAIAYADRILALSPDAAYGSRIQMSKARLVALSGDHGASSKAAKALLDAPTAKTQTFWFFADAALCYAAAATACKGDDELREKYAAEGVRLLRVCWEKDPKELPQLARFPEFRPHANREDFRKLKLEIDAKFPPPRELAPAPKAVK